MTTTDHNLPIKVLMVGPVIGGLDNDPAQQAKFNVKTLLGRVAALNKKSGPFDMAILVGDLFTSTDDETQHEIIDTLLAGKIDVPITTYWIPGSRRLPQSISDHVEKTHGELCPNLTYLGTCGVLTTAQGMKLAYVGGTDINITDTTLAYNADEVDALPSKAGEPDLFITYDWPQGIEQGSQKPYQPQLASQRIATIATKLCPRYHFAVSERVYYEREPYRSGSSDGHVSRFIGLAAFGNKEKMQWAYAMNIIPTVHSTMEQLAEQPAHTTDLPFSNAGMKRSRPNENDHLSQQVRWGDNAQLAPDTKRGRPSKAPPAGYVCKICNEPGHFIKECPQKTDRSASARPAKGPCWFCLGSPDVAKHLIASIGEAFYMALPKGALLDKETSRVPGGGHLLLIPIQHVDNLRALPSETIASWMAEKDRYMDSLTKFYAQYDAVPVVFEICRPGTQQHAHFQVVSIPKDKVEAVANAATTITTDQGLTLVDQLPSNPMACYFKLDLPDGQSFIHSFSPRTRFNLQLGRDILAQALEIPGRADWRQCVLSESEETQAANAFKQAFKPLDFTL